MTSDEIREIAESFEPDDPAKPAVHACADLLDAAKPVADSYMGYPEEVEPLRSAIATIEALQNE